MIPNKTIQELISKHSELEKDLSLARESLDTQNIIEKSFRKVILN